LQDGLLKIEWCNLSSLADDFLRSAFLGFQQQLHEFYPSFTVPKFSPLSDTLLDGLAEYLVSMLPGKSHDELLGNYASKKIFVFCDGDEPFVKAFQDQNELAHWGVAIPCTLAIAWEPRDYLVWHETLHLMNAKDCYNKFGINKCPSPQCIMRRAPSPENCGGRLELCSKNIKRIQRFTAELAADARLR